MNANFLYSSQIHAHSAHNAMHFSSFADTGILQPPLAPRIGLEHARIHAKHHPSSLFLSQTSARLSNRRHQLMYAKKGAITDHRGPS